MKHLTSLFLFLPSSHYWVTRQPQHFQSQKKILVLYISDAMLNVNMKVDNQDMLQQDSVITPTLENWSCFLVIINKQVSFYLSDLMADLLKRVIKDNHIVNMVMSKLSKPNVNVTTVLQDFIPYISLNKTIDDYLETVKWDAIVAYSTEQLQINLVHRTFLENNFSQSVVDKTLIRASSSKLLFTVFNVNRKI
jgi:hypothetical protein